MTEPARRHPGVEETCTLIASLPKPRAEMLWHLLSCPQCLERALALALEEEGGAGEDLVEGEAARRPTTFERSTDQHQAELARRFERDSKMAAGLLEELLAAPAPARPGLVEADRRFASPGLADRLLEAAADHAGGEPAEQEELARLALLIAGRVPLDRFGERAVARLGAKGWSRLGEARRLQDDPRGAEEAFGAALEAIEEASAPVHGLERALYCEQLALLRRDQERTDEALGLLTRAAEIYRRLGELGQLGEALAEKGRTLLDVDPAAAVWPLRLANELIPAASRPWPAARAWQTLAFAWLEIGEPAAAQRALGASRELGRQVRGTTAQLLCAWADGEIAGQLGRTEEAAEILGRAVRGLTAAGRLVGAALAAVDLAEILAGAGRPPALEELARELAARLIPRLPPQSALALSVALRVVGRPEVVVGTLHLLGHTRQLIQSARSGGAELAYRPSREPVLTVAWGQLPVKVRREACERAGVGQKVAERRPSAIPQELRQLITGVYQELTRTAIEWGDGRGV